MSSSDGARVDARNVLDVRLRSGRRIEYASPIVRMATSSLAHNATSNADDESDPTLSQPSQVTLFQSSEDAHSVNAEQLRSPDIKSGEDAHSVNTE